MRCELRRGKKVIDTREGALHFPRTNCASVGRMIRERDAHRRQASRGGDDEAATQCIFVTHESQSGFFVFISSSSSSLYYPPPHRRRLRLILLLPSLRDHEGYTTKQRSTKEDAFALLHRREKRFQSKKGRSAPRIPPVVSAGLGATEPLRGSTIRGLSGAQRERQRRGAGFVGERQGG